MADQPTAEIKETSEAYPALEIRDLPPPPAWSRALGVGVVMMGLAIGTGELILWPHLVVKHGLNLLSLALVGITCQYFINQEVARSALATGEGFFTSSARIFRWFAPFWLLSAVLLYVWPGWASALGTILKELFGFGDYRQWAWVSLILVLLLTAAGKVAYRVLEGSLKITVPTFFILLVSISFFNLDWVILKEGLLSLIRFTSLPEGVDWNVLWGAIVFAGAGGMLNLCVSLWYRDKQLGMAGHVGRITNPITGRSEAVAATGYAFAPTADNLKRWKGWLRYMRIDQAVIFWALGFITLFLLSLNAYAVLRPRSLVPGGLEVAVVQAHIFGAAWGVFGFKLFLIMTFLMLFSVMWTVIDALSRMVSDILYTNAQVGPFKNSLRAIASYSLGEIYYFTVVVVVSAGAILIPLSQPLAWLTLSAVLGGLTMAIYTPLLIYLNNTRLPKELRPGILTNLAMSLISLFFFYFAFRVIGSYFS